MLSLPQVREPITAYELNNILKLIMSGVGLTLKGGTGTFAGSASYTTITFATPMPDANYFVTVTASSAPAGALGEVWTANKTAAGFRVYNGGATTTTTFNYLAGR